MSDALQARIIIGCCYSPGTPRTGTITAAGQHLFVGGREVMLFHVADVIEDKAGAAGVFEGRVDLDVEDR